MTNPPYYVAIYGGFLVIEDIEEGRTRVFSDPNVRNASTFSSFDQADAAAKWAVNRLYPKDIQYFAILQPSFD